MNENNNLQFTEEIGMCPSCFKGNGPAVDFYAVRNENGEILEIHIFGDDDLDVTGKDLIVTDVKFSDDGKTITEVVCPRCKELISVNIPIVKKLDRTFVPIRGDKKLTIAGQKERE